MLRALVGGTGGRGREVAESVQEEFNFCLATEVELNQGPGTAGVNAPLITSCDRIPFRERLSTPCCQG